MIRLSEEKNISRLERIKDIVKQQWVYTRNYIIPYPPYDHTHCEKVEEKLNVLLPDIKIVDSVFSDDEKFLLLAAVWLHGIGMNPELFWDDKTPGVSKEDLKEWEKEQLRKKYPERSARFIKESSQDLALNARETDILATICLLHREKHLPKWKGSLVR